MIEGSHQMGTSHPKKLGFSYSSSTVVLIVKLLKKRVSKSHNFIHIISTTSQRFININVGQSLFVREIDPSLRIVSPLHKSENWIKAFLSAVKKCLNWNRSSRYRRRRRLQRRHRRQRRHRFCLSDRLDLSDLLISFKTMDVLRTQLEHF